MKSPTLATLTWLAMLLPSGPLVAAAALVPLALGPSSSRAATVPTPGPLDGRVRSIDYDPQGVVALQGFFGYAILIVLDHGERIQSVASGYADAWEVVNLGNAFTLKPRREAGDTNLAVITNRRIYTFVLSVAAPDAEVSSASREEPIFLLRFRYPDEEREAAANAAAGEAMARLLLEHPDGRTTDPLTPPTADGEPPGGPATTRAVNADYTYSGDVGLVPQRAWDDGRFTYFRFETGQDLPAIYTVNADGSESLVNKTFAGNTMIVEHLSRQFVLRLGQSVACIFNEGSVAIPASGGSRTISPRVVRELIGTGQP